MVSFCLGTADHAALHWAIPNFYSGCHHGGTRFVIASIANPPVPARRTSAWPVLSRTDVRAGVRLGLATVLPSVPLLLLRLALHLKSGVLNVDYLLLALLACGWSPAVAAVLFVLTYVLELVRLLDALYYFSGSDPLFAVRFIGEVQKSLVVGYGTLAVLLCIFSLWIWRAALPRQRGFSLWRAALPAVALLVLLGCLDQVRGFPLVGAGRHVRAGYRLVDEVLLRVPLSMVRSTKPHAAVTAVSSASNPLWQVDAIAKTKQNVVLILVESMGRLLDQQGAAKEFALFGDPALLQHYRVTTGLTSFTGSTISGEMRELCHERTGAYLTSDAFVGHAPCLPARYRDAGYQTTAFHGFRASMFQRSAWYPALGFTGQRFLGDMTGLPVCEGAFFGACDEAVAGLIDEQLRAHAAGQLPPQFLYWVTLNSHLPVNQDAAPGGPCPVHADRAVCAQLAYVQRVLFAAKQLAMDPQAGRTAMLLVGDHAPPFLSPGQRGRFDQGRVPFVYLEPR